jgi:hypothetical protein
MAKLVHSDGPAAPRDARGPSSGFEPLRKLYRKYVVGGAVAASAGLLFALGGGSGWLVPSLAIALGGCFLAFGVWGMRVGSATQVLSSSLNLVQANKLAEASALLDTLEPSTAAGVVMSCHIQRAMIALRLGDVDAVARHADQAIARPRRLLFRSTHDVQHNAALGLRAWARAARGDVDGAMADAQAVRASPVPTAEAMAHAALAEAMVLERRGDRAGLGALLRRDRRLLMNGLDVRERAVVRAMQRLLKAAPRSIYRTAAEPKTQGAEELPTLVDWLERVAPQLSAFAPRALAPTQAAAAPPALAPSAEAIAHVKAQAQAQAPKRSSIGWTKVIVLWVLLIMMFFAIWELFAPEGQPAPYAHVTWLPAPGPLSALWGLAMAAMLVGLFAWLVMRSQTQTATLHKLMCAIASGEDVDAELAEMAKSKQDLTAAQAELLRAHLADRRCQLAQGVAHVDAGRARLRTEATRVAAAGMLSPALAAARAYLLAALRRTDEALAELAQIPPDYPLYDRARFSVQLVALVARGDVDGAGRLVEATPPELSIGPRDELIRDLVRAATAPSGAGSAEIARLRDELREDEEARRWLAEVAPALLARFDQATAPDDDAPGAAAEGAAESEALAELEAAAAGARHLSAT